MKIILKYNPIKDKDTKKYYLEEKFLVDLLDIGRREFWKDYSEVGGAGFLKKLRVINRSKRKGKDGYEIAVELSQRAPKILKKLLAKLILRMEEKGLVKKVEILN